MGQASERRCRNCTDPLTVPFIDLGAQPPANRLLSEQELSQPETHYPLRAWVCSRCLLVQLEDHALPAELFAHYLYFSSYSQTWLEHSRRFADRCVQRFALGAGSRVVEVASNDGYLLQYFAAHGVPVLGVEPAANVADVAEQRGIPTVREFFGLALARRLVADGGHADLVIGNNVLAHVPDLDDFVAGLAMLAGERGRVSVEFPHLLNLVRELQFDTIYHEHYSYLSLLAVCDVFARRGLKVIDVERHSTHGGSLRVLASAGDGAPAAAVAEVLAEERAAGLDRVAGYASFAAQSALLRRNLLRFLLDARDADKRVVGYGAAAKGTTFLNACGVHADLLEFIVDASPHKQGRWLPGARIPVLEPAEVFRQRPDYVLVLPWNLRDEIIEQMRGVREWGARFVTAVPRLEVLA